MTDIPVTGEDVKSLDRLAIGRSLKIEDIEDMERHQNRLDRILDWSKMKGGQTRDDHIANLAELRNRIGNPSVFDLTVYIDLEMEHMGKMKMKEEIEKGIQDSESRLKKFEVPKVSRNEKGQFTA